MGTRSFEELTDSTNVADWIPADVYADLILDGVVCYGQLSGVITAMEYDFTAGGGTSIQVRYVSPRTHSCTSLHTNCSCLSATSTTFGTYDVPVRPWGDYDLVCGFSIWSAKGNIVSMILNEMSKRMAKCRDRYIWEQISSGDQPGKIRETQISCNASTATHLSSSCCTFLYDLYNSIVTLKQYMRGQAYDPDYVIMHPEVAAFLYFKEGGGVPFFSTLLPGVKFNEKGELLQIAGLKVIECCTANRCSTDAKDVMAVVIDSKRAVGEVWGKRPTFTEFYENDCDRYKYVLWQYWGANQLDPNAIGWIRNP